MIDHAALTLLERFSWSHKKYLNVLIIGSYGNIFKKHCDEHVISKEHSITITQFENCVFESAFLPFGQDSFDCIFSFFDMQWINDVPGYLKQLHYILKPGGLLSGVFIGGSSFIEMKEKFSQMELLHANGASLSFMPTIHASDAADLVQRAGFACPISDRYTDQFHATWMQIYAILKKLQATGFLKDVGHLTKEGLKYLYGVDAQQHTIETIFFSGLGVGRDAEKGNHTLFSTQGMFLKK